MTGTEIGGRVVDEFPCKGRAHGLLKWTIRPDSQAQIASDDLSNAFSGARRQKLHMQSRAPMTPAEFEAMLIDRTKALREHRDMTSAEMAQALDIPVDRYRKYESRTPIPHALIERFAIIVGVSPEFVLTGRRVTGKGPYPDVPGPHMIEEWRAARADSSRKRGRPPKK